MESRPLTRGKRDTRKLDLVLGRTYSLLDRDGEEVARDLLRPSVLTLRRDGGFYRPHSGYRLRSRFDGPRSSTRASGFSNNL
ncbi:hypothetical protein GCM10009733_010540 [Nonomuraea maheshkhaliensis]|uniref:Uncharacterized protein n=1 Tax=Nonomuraea maheshkhaliensis TaxID=419590 RepID=A0ABP4QP27_9ACTN